MEGTRASETVSVIQYQRKRKREQKIKDLESDLESIKKCGKENLMPAIFIERERFTQMQWDMEEPKRKCIDMEETTNSFIKENESLRQELDSTREQLKKLQEYHDEAELKSKADVKLLMKEIKSLRSSQSELRQELYRVEKERTPPWFERPESSSVLDIIGMNSLPDDVLIAILSHMTLMEAGRTSVLSRRWRHLWMFTSGSLDFDVMETKTRPLMDAEKLITWVNRVLKLHQGPRLDSFIVRLNCGGVHDNLISRWIYFAMQKEVKKLELKLGAVNWSGCDYDFPNLKKMLSLKCAFGSLRSLKLKYVNVTDEVVHYFLASCPNLEDLCVHCSLSTRNLKIVDPIPNLKILEILYCHRLESVTVSATSIVSFSFGGQEVKLLFEYIPNLSELTLKGDCAMSFIYEYEDSKHASYSVQLVKLSLRLVTTEFMWAVPRDLPLLYSLKQLELYTACKVGRSLLFFTLLIKAAPVLHEFRIVIKYNYDPYQITSIIPFPKISEAEAPIFYHKNLKVVEIVGYIGCPSEGEFLLQLFKVAPSLEKVVIELKSEHFDEESKFYCHKKLRRRIGARTMEEAKERAKHLQSSFPPKTELVIR